MNKTAIKNFAIEARRKLIASVIDKAGLLGITKDACTEPIEKDKASRFTRLRQEQKQR